MAASSSPAASREVSASGAFASTMHIPYVRSVHANSDIPALDRAMRAKGFKLVEVVWEPYRGNLAVATFQEVENEDRRPVDLRA